MKNVMLTREEINAFKTVGERIDKAMKEKGFKRISDLSRAIEQKRGNCPDRSIYSKLKTPTRPDQGYYNLSAENLYVIADILGVSTDYLLTGKEYSMHGEEDIRGLGLSETAIQNLLALRERAGSYDVDKIHSTSKYYRNPFNKRLDMLNWILEHIVLDEDAESDMDFLTSLYYMVMARFDGYKGGMMEVALSSLDTYAERDAYTEAVSCLYHNPVVSTDPEKEDERRVAEQDLQEKRMRYVCNEQWNRERRRVLRDYLDYGIVSITDPVTYDEVKIPLGNPQKAIGDHLQDIIEEWKEEYLPVYKKMDQKQTEEYQAWVLPVMDEYMAGGPMGDSQWQDVDEKEIPEPLRCRDPRLRSLTESQMRMYMMLEFLEDSGLILRHLGDKGELRVYDEKKQEGEIRVIMKSVAAQECGLYVDDAGRYMYDENRATPTYERLKRKRICK